MEGIGTVALFGGFLLAAVLLYVVLKQRKRSPRDIARTEEATRDLYARSDAKDQASDPDRHSF